MDSFPLLLCLLALSVDATELRGPQFVGETPLDGSCISVPYGSKFTMQVVVQSKTQLADVITTSLPEVQKSALIPTEEPEQWRMNITWMPTTSEAGPTTSVFCFYARDIVGFQSDQHCVTLIDEDYAVGPNIIQITPVMDVWDFNKNKELSWDVYVDEEVHKPSTSKYIFIQDKHGKVVNRINVLSDDVQILGKKLMFNTNFHWNDSKDYVMLFEQGLVTGNNSCHVESLSKIESIFNYHLQTGIDEQRMRHRRNTPPGLQTIVDNSANEFFIAFYRNYNLYTASLQLFVNTPEPNPVSFTVTASGYSYTGMATNSGSVIVTLPSSLEVQSSSERNKAIYVKATGNSRITVYGSSLLRYTSDSFLALPCLDQSLDEYEYYAMCYYGLTNSPCALLFVACQDNTHITTPYGSITLNRLQTYLIERNGDTTGARITSTKPISFFSSNRCSFVPSSIRYCDYLTEQLPPTSTWGREFLVASLLGRRSQELYRIIASRTSSTFTVACVGRSTLSYTLSSAGSWQEVVLADNSYCSIEASAPVLVAQFAYGTQADGVSADPFMVMIPPIDQFSNRYVFNVLSTFSTNFITVYVSPQYYQRERIFLDGANLASWQWTTVQCSDGTVCGYITGRSMSAGSHVLFHDDLYARIGLTVYGFDSYDSYGYPGGLILDAISASCYNGDARLISRTGYDFEGRVEVCANGEWGTVCDDSWGNADAQVICRQLNITTTGLAVFYGGTYGQGIGPINLDDVACSGSETSLLSCTYDSNTADCTHAEDAGVRCHSLPTIIGYGALYNSGTINYGDFTYFLITSWTSSGVTLSLFLTSGSVILFASDTTQSPSALGGYVWRLQSSGYSELFLNPSTLGRPAGDYVAIALQGNTRPTSSFVIQVDSGNTVTTALSLGVVTSRSLTSGQWVYYSFPYPSEGITVTLTVISGTINCYASLINRRPHASNYTWTLRTSGTNDLFLDPETVTSIPRSRVFVSFQGASSSNTFSFTSIASFPSIELTIGSLVRNTLQQGRSVIYFVPFPSNGLTIRIEAITGTIRCYASDTNQRPNAMDNVWTLLITEYDDAFLDPSSLGRTPGTTLYITLEGVDTSNEFTLNTTYGDTSITDLTLGSAITLSIASGVVKYYAVPFTSGGITVRLDVSVGYITCYASDTFRNPGPGNYVWLINTGGYADRFIDPASQFGRSGTRYIYIALVGVSALNTYLLNSTSGNFSSQEVTIGNPVSDSIGSGQFRFYIFPFLSGGVTVRVEVSRGGVWCYASDTNRNPSSRDYIWRLFISEYDDSFIDPSSLDRTAGSLLFIAIEGTQSANSFTLNTTTGDTSIADVGLGVGITATIASGVTKYYAIPFTSGGITLRLDVSVGYIRCYASDIFRNPGPGNYVWLVNTGGYADGFTDPASQFGRSGTRYIYVALVGVNALNTYLLNSTSGNFSSQEVSIGDPVYDSIGRSRFRYYILPFLSGGVTIRVEVSRGGVWCYASDTNRNPNSENYIWRLFISEYNDSFIDPTSLGRTPGAYLFIAIEGNTVTNDFSLNSTMDDTSIANYGLGVGITATIATGVTKYYAIPFTSGGITLRLDVSVGYITCYASDIFRNPGPGNYVWLVNTGGYADGFIDPASQFGRSGTRYIYVALVGVNVLNTYLLNSTSGNYSSQEVEIGNQLSDSIGSGQFRYYIFPFLSGGVTIRVEAFRGGVWCYASDANRNPNSGNYIWRIFISEYGDSYIDPRSLGRVAGPFLFIAIEGTGTNNDFTLNSTTGDTSIANIAIDVGITATIASGVTKYYAIPFTSGGITLRLDVSVGYITCYASDTFRNPGPGNYVWLVNTGGYADGFIDPASQFGRSGTRYIYVALVGVNALNTYLLNSTSGNFSSQEVEIGNQLSDSIGSGQFRYYIFPFLSGGVTIRVEAFRGGVWCYASDANRNPNSGNYIWRIFISEYGDSYIDPRSLGRVAGPFLFIAIEGTGTNNDFTLNSTTGDTSIANIAIDVGITATIASGVTKYYAIPFTSGGITVRLDVSVGYITCYASDIFRNPGPGNYVWLVNTGGYADRFIDPASQFGRSGTRYIYVALVGVNALNTYLLNSTSGNFSSQEVAIGDPVYDSIGSSQFRFYIFPFLTEGVTIRVEVFRGGVWCYASDTNRNPSSRDYIWRLYITSYNDSYIDPTSLGRTPGDFLFIAIEGIDSTNNFTVNSTAGDTSITDLSIGTVFGNTISNGVIKFYSLPFPANGLTLNLTVSSGYVYCYASDRFRNPNQYMYDWFITVRDYWEVYLDPRTLSRSPGSFLYASFLGINTANVYQAESAQGNTLTVEPQPPFDLQANNILPTAATITWSTAPPNRVTPWGVVINYELILTEYAFGLLPLTANSTVESFTFTELEEFNNYSVIIAAENRVGLGDYSIVLNFSTPQAPPTGPPQNPSGTQVTITLITLSWSPPEPIHINGIIDHYEIRVREIYTGRVFSLLSENEDINIGPLHPFYVYSCQIAAYTVGLGPFGPSFSVQAGEKQPTAPPQDVTYGGRTNVSITLIWNPPPFEHQNGQIRSYSIRVTYPLSGTQQLLTTNSSYTNFTIRGLLPYSNYFFSIAAETISLGPYSSTVSISTVEGIPTVAPENVTLSAINATTIYLSWEGVTTRVGILRDYVIRVLEVDTGLLVDYRSSFTSIAVSVHPDYVYRCSVSAFTVASGPFSEAVIIKTPQAAPSGTPQNLSVLATSPRTAFLTWAPPDVPLRNGEIILYTINVSVVESEEMLQFISESTELELSSLRPYHTYMYMVAASTVAGEGPFTVAITIRMPEDLPTSPTSVQAERISGQPNQLLVTWQPPATPNGLITNYMTFCFESEKGPVEDTSDDGGTGADTDMTSSNITLNFEDSASNITVLGSEMLAVVGGLDPYTRYDCVVIASTLIGEGPPSYFVSGVTDQSTPGSTPLDFSADVIESFSILFSWSPPAVPNGQIVSYTITYNQTGLPTSVNVSNGTQYLISELEAYTFYQFIIFASTVVGDGPATVPLILRTDIAIPTAPPRNFSALVTGTTSVEFSWQPPLIDDHNGLLSYYQLRLVDESFHLTDLTINTTNTSYSITTLEEYVRYSCQVAAATDIGLGPFSSPVEITTLQDVPSASPQSLTGSVESSTLILLSWEPPPPYDRNGEIVYYLIHMRELETGRFWTLPVFNSKISAYIGSLHPYYHYECKVAAYTIALGPYSESISLLTDEEAPSSPPMAVLPQMVTATSLTLTWQPPSFESRNGVIKQYIIQIEEVNTGRMLTASSNTTEVTIDSLHPFYSYSCRIAAETIQVGPYTIPVLVQLDEDVPTSPPTVNTYYAVDSSSLYLSWSAPPADQQNGLIRHYNITLTELETGSIFSYTTTNTNFTVTLLHPNYQYQFEISAVTIGTGPNSIPMILQLPEDAPSAPPDEISIDAVYFDSVYLSWRAPLREYHNGEIIGYNVTFTATGSGEVLNIFSASNSTVIGSLSPFTSYIIGIAAVTSAGVGPYSAAITVKTAESAPSSPPEQLNVTAVSSSSLSLTWSPPPVTSRNGIIREYRINLTELDTGRELVLYSTTTTLTATSLHPYYTYVCYISASTVGYGPYSVGVQITTPEDVPSGFPQDISIDSTSSQSAEISWNPPLLEERNGIITSYTITVSRQGSDSQIQLTSATTSISVNMLNPFTTYTVTIAASTSIGVGPPSTQFSFRTAEDVPAGAPLNPSTTVIDSRTLSFTWEEPLEELRNGIIRQYQINVTEVDTGRQFQVVSSTTSISVSSLHPYYTYRWAVSAFTIGGGPFSQSQMITTPEDAPSGAPQMLIVTGTGVTNISLTWQQPLPGDRNGIILGFVIRLLSVSGRDTRELTTAYTNITVASLTPYTLYECVVAAYTSVGIGPSSSIIFARTEPTNPSGTPSNTSGVALNSTHIYIDWDPPPEDQRHGELQEYRITVNEIETSTSLLVSSDPDVTEAIIGPLHPYYTYDCTILAVTVGEGPPSTVVTVRTEEDVPSGPPTNFTLSPLSSTSIQLSWDLPLPENRNGIVRQYIVHVELPVGEILSYTTSSNSYALSGLRPYTTYFFSVAAITVGAGPTTERIVAQTVTDAPEGPPLLVSAQPFSPSSLILSWEPPVQELRNGIIQEYNVRIIEQETGRVITLSTTDTRLNVTSLHPYYTYNCTVAAATFVGTGPFSSPVVIQLPETAPSSPPSGVSYSQVTSTSFTLSWSAPSPEDHNGLIRHYIVRCTELETGAVFQRLTVNSSTERLVDSLHPHYNYQCAVAAVTIAEGPFSSNVTVITAQDAPTSAPIGLRVISQSSTSLTLAWMVPPLERQNGIITGYSINVTDTDTGASMLLSSIGEFITVTQLSPYTSYHCSVAAQTAVGLGPYTSPIIGTTDEDAPMGSPVSLEVLSTLSTSVTLSWSPPPEGQLNGVLRHYVLTVQELDSSRNVTLTSVNSMIVLSDLHPFYTYAISVCPVTVDVGPCAHFDPIQLPQDSPSSAPVNIAALSLTSTSLQLSWSPPPANQQNGIITDYYINMTEVETGVTVQLTVTGATMLLIDTLHPYYVYNFFVSAATIVGQGPYSTLFSIQTPEDAPSSPPLNSSGEVLGPTAISVSWQPPVPEGQNGIITSYTVLITEVPTNTTTTYRRDGSRTELVITGLHPYYDYSCAVAAQTSVGLGPFSALFTVTTHQDSPSSPPESIEGSVSSSTSIQLTWQPPAPSSQNGIIQRYVISVTEEETMRQFQLMSTTTSLTVTALHPYYTYSFTISAVTVGEGPYSQPLSLRTLEDAPSGPPQSFRVVAISSTSIRLTWSAPREEEQNGVITSYRITVTEVESGERVLEMTAAASDTLLIVNSLNPHFTYRCSISAVTIAIGMETSAEVTTFQEAPSGSPQNVTVSVIDSSRVEFEWVALSAEDSNGIVIGYIIRVTGQDTNEFIELQTNMTSIQVENLHPFYSYVFTVAARTEAGVGPFSPVIHLQMPSAAPIGIVSNMTIQIESPTSVRLSWLPINPRGWNGIVTNYIVRYERQGPAGSVNTPPESYVISTASIPSLPEHPLANSPDPRLATLPLTQESLLLEGLEENYVYEFTVYCVNSAGSSETSIPVTITMPSSAPSGAPLNVTVIVQSSTSILISWQPPETLKQNGIISSYDVEINSTKASLQPRKYRFLANTTNVIVTGLDKYTDFLVFVAAGTSLGNGPFSKSVIVKTLEDVPDVPRSLDVISINPSAVRVSWSPPISANGIILEYQVQYVGYDKLKIEEKEQKASKILSAGSKQDIVIANLTGGLIYEFKVRARTSVGYGNFSAPKEIEVKVPIDGGLSEPGSGGGGTVAVAVVFAILGWVILIAIIVAVISALIWYKRNRSTTKKLGLHDTQGIEIPNQVFLQSYGTKEEDIEGDVISNPTTAEDNSVTAMDRSKAAEKQQLEKEVEGDVISNSNAIEDDPKVDLSKNMEEQ